MIVRWLIRVCALAAVARASLIDEVDTKLLSRRNITEKTGAVCAYADFNGDRLTDVLHYHNGKLYVLLQQQNSDFTEESNADTQKLIVDLGGEYAEVACSVGDINADGYHDIVVSLRKAKGDNGHWTIKYFTYAPAKEGADSRFVQGDLDIKAKYQVALIDVTGDGVHDLLGVHDDGDGTGEKLLCREGGAVDSVVFKTHCDAMFFPEYKGAVHALMPVLFGDVDGDRYAELIFMKHDKDGGLRPEIWKRNPPVWERKKELQLPEPPAGVSFKYTLAPMLADLDLNARMDLIVPVCKDESCTSIDSLQVIEWDVKEGKWAGWKRVEFDMGANKLVAEQDTLVRMKVGDANLDGYPDLLVTLGSIAGGNNYAAVIENTANDEAKGKDGVTTRKFKQQAQMMIMPGLALGMIQSSSFFDFAEDGYLDVLVQWKLRDGDDWQWSLCLSEAKEMGDVTFLKVQTFVPLPASATNHGDPIKMGLGVVWGGVCVTYVMETTGIGETRNAIECQLPANSHKAGLAPPFTLFGLGRNPNFIDVANIGVPRNIPVYAEDNKKNPLLWHEQKQIVPNARMMVQPPKNTDQSWILRLYLTPSTLIMASLLVMASTCSILLIVVLVLHLREKKVDRVERAAQSHRFHFDAM